MAFNPTPEQISEMWWKSRDLGKDMLVLGTTPSGEEFRGYVAGRGSKMRVVDPDFGTSWDDVESSWVDMAWLVAPFGRADEG